MCIRDSYTLSALIVPERAIDLFQQLLFSEDDIWNIFLNSAEEFKSFQQEQNDSDLKKTIEEGVWLIINYIIEDKFQLPQIKTFVLFPLGELSSQKKFFAEEDNFWIKGIFLSYQKFINPGQQQENKSSSFQRFCESLDNAEYRENNKKGYEKITQFFSQSSKKTYSYKKAFSFFYNLINVNTIFQVHSAPPSDVESVFNDFVENGNLSLQNIVFVTTDTVSYTHLTLPTSNDV